MVELVTMPKLGFDMAEGTLTRWVKVEGDVIKKGEVIAEIETDKATVEVESSHSGIMYHHVIEEGTTLPVNAPIAVIVEEGEKPSQEEIDALIAKAGGEPRKKDVKEEKKVKEKAPASKNEEEQSVEAQEEIKGVMLAGGTRSSPLARRMAEDEEIQLTEVEGTGPRGRVIKKDIERYLETMREEGREVVVETVEEVLQPLKSFTVGEVPEDEVIEMSRLRQAIGRRMQDSNQNFPHFFVTRSYKMGSMMKLRKELNELLPEAEKLSVNDFILKAVALAMRQYPYLNASIEDGTHIRRHGHVNIGVAVAVGGGLLTVVVKDADQKPLRIIAREVREMATRAREGKVRNEDIQGSTFSISNLGMYVVDNFSAIINPPETGILAISAVKQQPVVEDGELKVGMRMNATLSADHRVTDGAEAAEYMQVLANYLEEPMWLLL